MAASLSSFAIQQRTGVALEPSYLVLASSPLPICVSSLSSSTTPPSLSFTPASLMSALQVPVPGSAHAVFFSFTMSCVTTCFTGRLLKCLFLGLGILLLVHQTLHFLCQHFQCLTLIFRLHLLFLHQLYCLLLVHFLNVIPLFPSPAAIHLYLV